MIANALPGIQAPLASAAEVAEVTNGDETRFTRVCCRTTAVIQKNSAFSDLGYALYLGAVV
jgi:hypothetical protein